MPVVDTAKTTQTIVPDPSPPPEPRSPRSVPWNSENGAPPLTADTRRSDNFVLAVDETSVATARRSTQQSLRSWGIKESMLDDVLLIVSELVTNAVQHAGALTDLISLVLMEDREKGLILGVRDHHPALPHTEQHSGLACWGRGLGIVRTLTDEAGGQFGVRQQLRGSKIVWARLPGAFS